VGDALLQLAIAAGKRGDRIGDDFKILDIERVAELEL
jgi:hypothetical protein